MQKEIYYEGLIYVTMEAEKSDSLQAGGPGKLLNPRPWNQGSQCSKSHPESEGLRTKSSDVQGQEKTIS